MADGNPNKDFLSKRLKEYIKTARERTESYRKDSKRYFQINLTLASALITTLTFFISFFNNPDNLKILNFFIILIIGVFISLILVFITTVYEFFGKDTNFGDFTRKTISFYKDNVPENNKPDNLKEDYKTFVSNFKDNNGDFIKNENKLIEDDIRSLFVLHYYASNYQKISKNFRKLLLSEVIIILVSIFIQLNYCVFLVFTLEIFWLIFYCEVIFVILFLFRKNLKSIILKLKGILFKEIKKKNKKK